MNAPSSGTDDFAIDVPSLRPAGSTPPDPAARHWIARLLSVRGATESLIAGLTPEDCALQSMPKTSPVKWHLGHTAWFFETFVLEPHEPGFEPCHPAYRVLFNSYYNSVGQKHPRPMRGQIIRLGAGARLTRRRRCPRISMAPMPLHSASPCNAWTSPK